MTKERRRATDVVRERLREIVRDREKKIKTHTDIQKPSSILVALVKLTSALFARRRRL